MDKVQRDEDKNTREAEEQKSELADLQDYEEKFKARLKGYQQEVKDLEDFQKALKKSVENIECTLNEKDKCKNTTFKIKLDINALKIQRDALSQSKDSLIQKLANSDSDIEEFMQVILTCEKQLAKLEKDKKKAAADKKFKEAAKAQQDIKDTTNEMEEA